MEKQSLLISEMPYPVPPKSAIRAGNRDCQICHEQRSKDQASKADYTCVEGEQYFPLCLSHAEEWASAHGLKLPARRAEV